MKKRNPGLVIALIGVILMVSDYPLLLLLGYVFPSFLRELSSLFFYSLYAGIIIFFIGASFFANNKKLYWIAVILSMILISFIILKFTGGCC